MLASSPPRLRSVPSTPSYQQPTSSSYTSDDDAGELAFPTSVHPSSPSAAASTTAPLRLRPPHQRTGTSPPPEMSAPAPARPRHSQWHVPSRSSASTTASYPPAWLDGETQLAAQLAQLLAVDSEPTQAAGHSGRLDEDARGHWVRTQSESAPRSDAILTAQPITRRSVSEERGAQSPPARPPLSPRRAAHTSNPGPISPTTGSAAMFKRVRKVIHPSRPIESKSDSYWIDAEPEDKEHVEGSRRAMLMTVAGAGAPSSAAVASSHRRTQPLPSPPLSPPSLGQHQQSPPSTSTVRPPLSPRGPRTSSFNDSLSARLASLELSPPVPPHAPAEDSYFILPVPSARKTDRSSSSSPASRSPALNRQDSTTDKSYPPSTTRTRSRRSSVRVSTELSRLRRNSLTYSSGKPREPELKRRSLEIASRLLDPDAAGGGSAGATPRSSHDGVPLRSPSIDTERDGRPSQRAHATSDPVPFPAQDFAEQHHRPATLHKRSSSSPSTPSSSPKVPSSPARSTPRRAPELMSGDAYPSSAFPPQASGIPVSPPVPPSTSSAMSTAALQAQYRTRSRGGTFTSSSGSSTVGSPPSHAYFASAMEPRSAGRREAFDRWNSSASAGIASPRLRRVSRRARPSSPRGGCTIASTCPAHRRRSAPRVLQLAPLAQPQPRLDPRPRAGSGPSPAPSATSGAFSGAASRRRTRRPRRSSGRSEQFRVCTSQRGGHRESAMRQEAQPASRQPGRCVPASIQSAFAWN